MCRLDYHIVSSPSSKLFHLLLNNTTLDASFGSTMHLHLLEVLSGFLRYSSTSQKTKNLTATLAELHSRLRVKLPDILRSFRSRAFLYSSPICSKTDLEKTRACRFLFKLERDTVAISYPFAFAMPLCHPSTWACRQCSCIILLRLPPLISSLKPKLTSLLCPHPGLVKSIGSTS
jgi:hypothetical protein